MHTDRSNLLDVIHKNKIPQLIVDYLKLQQANNADFFNLLLNKKMNGRIFYNTCLPGAKEVRYGHEDFLKPDFQATVDHLLADFKQLSTQQFRSEFMRPTELSIKMNNALTAFLAHLETSREWQGFWEHDIKLQASAEQKKQLYNLIAGNAAYKAFVTCANHSNVIESQQIKNNIVMLIGICSDKYESTHLQVGEAFGFNKAPEGMSDVGVFKSAHQETITDNGHGALALK
jgi:hypothetical protein